MEIHFNLSLYLSLYSRYPNIIAFIKVQSIKISISFSQNLNIYFLNIYFFSKKKNNLYILLNYDIEVNL